jgi:hypothetical protein
MEVVPVNDPEMTSFLVVVSCTHCEIALTGVLIPVDQRARVEQIVGDRGGEGRSRCKDASGRLEDLLAVPGARKAYWAGRG